jgi:hypothetical protein
MLSLVRKLHSDGYVEIAETNPSVSTLQFARELSAAIGTVASESVESIVASPEGVKPPNTYGGNYGYGQLPLHTDLAHWYLPPRYVLLRCISGTQSVKTHLFNRRQLEKWIPTSLMQRALFSPRRRLEGKVFLLRMFTDELFRWDQLFLRPQNAAAREAVEQMQEVASKLPTINVALSQAGQTLLIDNWNVLHGRSAVPPTESNRKLDRIYLETT